MLLPKRVLASAHITALADKDTIGRGALNKLSVSHSAKPRVLFAANLCF